MHLEMALVENGNLHETTSLKKIDFSSPISHQPPIAPQLGGGALVVPLPSVQREQFKLVIIIPQNLYLRKINFYGHTYQ